jgi:predicted DNA-binding transcriptional regulator YafY
MRSAVNRSDLTRTEKEIITAILNLWLHHRNGPLGYIHPSKRMIARRATCTERTVQRCLQMLKASGVLIVVRNEKGGRRLAPHYRLNLIGLLTLCGSDIPQEMEGFLTMIDSRFSAPDNRQNRCDRMSQKGDSEVSKCLPLREAKCLPVYRAYRWPAFETNKPAQKSDTIRIVWMDGKAVGNA